MDIYPTNTIYSTVPGAVIEDKGRPPDQHVHRSRDAVGSADEHLTHVLPTVTLLKIFDLQHKHSPTLL